ncbi:MAG: vWA domain-containing protein, partial [Planctomycetaceae bacterium]|nr:vWA domain-containing protein [Planctomycetaceae bacterium]
MALTADLAEDDVLFEDAEVVRAESPVIARPVASRWAGIGLSVLLHVWLLGTLGGMLMEGRRPYQSVVVDTVFDEVVAPLKETEPIKYELANPGDEEKPQATSMNAASIGRMLSDIPKQEAAPIALPDYVGTLPSRPMYDIPEGMRVSEKIVVQGTTGEGMIQLEGALDRITWEVSKHLQEKRVLLVWLIDASGSLNKQREAVAKRMKRIYGELNALEQQEQFARQDRPILTGVVSFGQQTNFLTKEPTDNFTEIVDAVTNAPNDPSGVENVFGAVTQVIDRWHKYRIDHGRRILIVTVTDEAGDDHGSPLDLAIAKCRRYGAVAYVLGPASPFGKRRGYVPYVAPEDRKTYQLPVDLGPESVVVENVDIPFWYDGPQYENLSSGFGPYAMSRLVKETGGVYFTTQMTTMAGLATVGTYDPHLMKAFEPDYGYGSQQDFLIDMAKHPIRGAVFAMAQYSQTTSLKANGTPQMSFRLQPNNFRAVLSEAQKSAAVSGLAIDSILAHMPPNAEKAYDSESSLRWRLAFSLNYGRLLAQKIRSLEYNTALATLKGSLAEADISSSVNQLIFRPDREV